MPEILYEAICYKYGWSGVGKRVMARAWFYVAWLFVYNSLVNNSYELFIDKLSDLVARGMLRAVRLLRSQRQ
jgi:hypothetical protein